MEKTNIHTEEPQKPNTDDDVLLPSGSSIKSHNQESTAKKSNLVNAEDEPETLLKSNEIGDSTEKEGSPPPTTTNDSNQPKSTKLHDNDSELKPCPSSEVCQEASKKKNNADAKPKMLPKVLSKLCLGPGSGGFDFEPATSLNVEDTEPCRNSEETPEKENTKYGSEENIKSVPIVSKEVAINLLLGENEEKTTGSKTEEQVGDFPNTQSDNGKSVGSKLTLPKSPKVLQKLFLPKNEDVTEKSKSKQKLYTEQQLSISSQSSIDNEYLDIDEGVELRKKKHVALKRTLSESFRRSFRVKRTHSAPAKEKEYEVKPRRSNTFKIFSKALLQTAAVKMQPPAPLLVEDPPSSDDVSDLEDVKHLADPALLNGSSGNFGSAGARSAPSTPQGVQCTTPGGLTEPLSQPCSPVCTSPSIQRSPSHSVFTKCEKASLKHLSTSTPVMTAQAQLTEPPSPKATKDPKVHTTSKARQKKFLRHFPNVEDDEKVLNHYSCALIGDILLQGHLYITKNYFAFYSNVFGYVTKLLIPILTVENITKEKTARIIPNAVGIATSEDKHVFGSLMSRDNTLQYMRTVWQKAKSASPVIIEPEITEQDLDSSESGDGESGRDSPPPEMKPRFSLVKKLDKESLPNQTEGLLYERKGSKGLIVTLKEAISEFRKLPRQSLILFATTLLLILLFLSAAVLLYRISKIQNKYSLALQDNVVVSGSEDIYSDLLQWQTQLHSKSAGAVHSFLDSNLDQIAKVRQSLEALSSLLIQNSNPLAQESNAKPLEATKDAS